MFHWKFLLPFLLTIATASWCLVMFAGWYSVTAKWALQHVWENRHPVLGDPKRSACRFRNLHVHSGEQRWEGVSVCRAHRSRYGWECAGERNVSHHILLKCLWLCSQYLTRNIHFLLSSLSLPLFIKWCCGSLEHATAVNCVGSMGEKGNPSVCNRFL